MRFYSIIITLIFLLFACSNKLGNRVEGDKITVFFDTKNDLELAEKIANFWMKEDLVGNNHTYLKLEKSKNHYYLKLIARDQKEAKNMSFEHRLLLLGLQKKIGSILPKSNSIELVICNNKFEQIKGIN